ncbi:sensor histidine kinase [Halalkalibacter wakoensis JCM 9140]|uniref:histidine kinase n=1 Tax=Halalkalibacter wakoensis JCM 9140 TaxID=1236970 RepID=W4Q4U7_9BACI|nr:histidine kinase N-terminal domain-containing protein [Halalkalibacter wakoensis]GAE27111.1 sensor histidine kinase [Halalkalibacter wakoensis JCM 9140]
MSTNPHRTNSLSEMVVTFLEKNESEFLTKWQESISIEPTDIHKEKVKRNGYFMYLLVKKTLRETITEDEVIHLAYKVAKERVEAKSNIGDFVYNVNLGRSILITFTLQSGASLEQVTDLTNKINEQFDRFCYYAVKKYTEMKEFELEQKNLFISQTHKDRLSILGQMSSSFVHEFRNPLTSVIGFNKLLRSEYPNLKYLDIIELELDQLKFRITQFLHTSKFELVDHSKEKIQIRPLLDDIIHFLYPSIVDNDVVVSACIEEDIELFAYKDELKQVFLNVLFNSIDAVVQREKPREIHVAGYKDENHAFIEITNNGPMIPIAVQETIFEPFYTTKELGTGIGLFVCRKIIEKHSGQLSFSSSEEKTSFFICLPLS